MREKFIQWFKNEYVNDYKLFDYLFLLALVVMQVVVFIIYPDSPISIIATIAGTICTVLCAKGKISFYILAYVQTILFCIIDWQMSFYIDLAEQGFYLLTMFYGIYAWKKNLQKTEEGSVEVRAKKLTWWQNLVMAIIVIAATFVVGYIGQRIGSHQPYTDAFSNVCAVFAQILLVACYREQWILWIILDIADIKMYFMGGNPVVGVMYIGWTLNCIYGWYNWTKSTKKHIAQG